MGEQLADERAVGSRPAAWCIFTSVEQKEKTDGKEQQAAYAREYVGKVETELQKIFGNILALMDKIAKIVELSIEIGSARRLTSRNSPRLRAKILTGTRQRS